MQKELEAKLSSLPERTPIELLDTWLVQFRLKTLLKSPPRVLVTSACNATELRLKAEAVLHSHQIRGEILCVIPSGSHCYGSALAESSADYVAVFAVPTAQAVSMISPAQRIDTEHGVDTKGTSAPTSVRGLLLLELGYAASLLKCTRCLQVLLA